MINFNYNLNLNNLENGSKIANLVFDLDINNVSYRITTTGMLKNYNFESDMDVLMGTLYGNVIINNINYKVFVNVDKRMNDESEFYAITLQPINSESSSNNLQFSFGVPFVTNEMYDSMNSQKKQLGYIQTRQNNNTNNQDPLYEDMGGSIRNKISLFHQYATAFNRMEVAVFSDTESIQSAYQSNNMFAQTGIVKIRTGIKPAGYNASRVSLYSYFESRNNAEWNMFKNTLRLIFEYIPYSAVVLNLIDLVTTPQNSYVNTNSHAYLEIQFGLFEYMKFNDSPMVTSFDLETTINGLYNFNTYAELEYTTLCKQTQTSMPMRYHESYGTEFICYNVNID